MAAIAGKVGALYRSRNYCIDFPAATDYVAIGDQTAHEPGADEDFSIEMMVMVTSDGIILDKWNANVGYMLESQDTRKLKWYITDQSVIATVALTAGVWNHVVCVRDCTNTNAYLYVNGTQYIMGEDPDEDTAGAIPLTLGAAAGGFIGKIGFCRLVIGTAFTQAEVTALYHNTATGHHTMKFSDPTANDVSYWSCDDGTGSVLTDIVGGYNGTLTNNAAYASAGITVTDETQALNGSGVGTTTYRNTRATTLKTNPGGVIISPDLWTCTPYGTITCASQASSNVDITYTYYVVSQLAGFFNWSFDWNCDVLETTDFQSSGYREFIASLFGWNGTAERHWLLPGMHWKGPGDDVLLKFFIDASPLTAATGIRFEGWGQVTGISPSSSVDALVNEALTFQGDGLLQFQASV